MPTNAASTRTTNNIHWIIFALILMIGIVARVLLLERPFSFDEALTFLDYGSINPRRALQLYNLPNNHVFHTMALQVSYRLLGDSPVAVRLPAFIAGVLILPVSYWAARLFNLSRPAALLAMGINAGTMWMLDYSSNARGYSIIVLIMLLQMGLGVLLLKRQRWWMWAIFALLCAIGLWTIPVYVFPLGGICLWLLAEIVLWRSGRNRLILLRNFIASLAVGALLTIALYAPIWTRPFGLDLLINNRFVTSTTSENADPRGSVLLQSFQRVIRILTLGIFPPFAWLMLAIAIVPILIAAWHLLRKSSRLALPEGLLRVGFIGLIHLLWIVILLTVQQRVPPMRTFLYLVPIEAILIGTGAMLFAAWIKRRSGREFPRASLIVPAALSTATAIFLIVWVFANDELARYTLGYAPDAEGMTAAIADRVQPNDLMLFAIPYGEPIRYYLFREGVRDVSTWNQYREYEPDFLQSQPADARVYIVLCTDLPRECKTDNLDQFLSEFRFDLTGLDPRFEPIASFPGGTIGELVYTRP